MVNYIEPLKGDFSERVPSERAVHELVVVAQFMKYRFQADETSLPADARELLRLDKKDSCLIGFGLQRVRRNTLNIALGQLLEYVEPKDDDYNEFVSSNLPDFKLPKE